MHAGVFVNNVSEDTRLLSGGLRLCLLAAYKSCMGIFARSAIFIRTTIVVGAVWLGVFCFALVSMQ